MDAARKYIHKVVVPLPIFHVPSQLITLPRFHALQRLRHLSIQPYFRNSDLLWKLSSPNLSQKPLPEEPFELAARHGSESRPARSETTIEGRHGRANFLAVAPGVHTSSLILPLSPWKLLGAQWLVPSRHRYPLWLIRHNRESAQILRAASDAFTKSSQAIIQSFRKTRKPNLTPAPSTPKECARCIVDAKVGNRCFRL